MTGGTVVKMAMDMGWRPAPSQPGHELSWDDEINAKDEQVIVNTAWLESKEIQEPPDSKWYPAHDLIEYLGTLFSPDDYVGYVTETFEAEDGERKPTRGNYDRTAGQLIEALKKCGDDLGAVLGDYDPGTGAWIRFNPLDGKGVKNDNVTTFRFALGFSCAQGRVLYVNLELDRASCLHRFRDVYEALGYPPQHLGSIDVWNLRGRSIPMDKLAPKLIRRAMKKNYIAIVIDPIYKVITGDENSADQMAKFCNQFDKVCTELGCAVIYCHHHSKGSQGSKRSMDRASGSGVFARDPDALLDLIELPIGEDLRKQEINNAVGRACTAALQAAGKLDEVSQDDLCSEKAALAAVEAVLGPQGYRDTMTAVEAAKKAAEARTGWRIDGTLREFPKFPPVNLWFDFPVHLNDESGVLADIDPEGDTPGWQRNFKKRKSPEARKKDKEASLETAFEACNFGEEVTLKILAEYMGVSEDTVRRRVNGHKGFYIAKGTVGRKATAKS